MFDHLRYLLLQVRNPDDPMRQHEVRSFARALGVPPGQIRVFDMLAGRLGARDLAGADVFLLGGSGHYSAAGEGEWLDRALDSLRLVYETKQPTFASCWGFQALARALGGRVVKDLSHAEVGTHELCLTEAGKADPVFGPLGECFDAQMGHEDRVVELPPGAVRLAYSQLVENQAYRFDDRPIYCTQFHPELNRDDLFERVRVYPEYVERIAGLPPERFPELLRDTDRTEALLRRFVAHVFDGRQPGEGR
ncbi:MAG TPA: type 1 glutamine amidotransferase [Planctomycetaceae bacterium]|nr:type 1 glutamine amidotransferase [Planctomycetaceae bacterium]